VFENLPPAFVPVFMIFYKSASAGIAVWFVALRGVTEALLHSIQRQIKVILFYIKMT